MTKRSSSSLPAAVTEVVPGRVYAIGGSIPNRPCLTWMPAASDEWIPLQCYVLRDGNTAVIIDTGTAAHRYEVRAGLNALLAGTTHRELMFTRREPDNAMNLDWIASDFKIDLVRCAGELNPLDFFDSVDDANTLAIVKSATKTPFQFIRAGDLVQIGSFAFDVLRPPIRVLTSSWHYERTTRTMFCSDLWGHITRPRPVSPTVCTPTEAELSVEVIRDFIGAKFDYLWSIDTAPAFEDISKAMETHPSDRLCPSYGCIIEGAESVRKMLAQTKLAMAQLAKAPYRSALQGFELGAPV